MQKLIGFSHETDYSKKWGMFQAFSYEIIGKNLSTDLQVSSFFCLDPFSTMRPIFRQFGDPVDPA
jgi:hypothetical protein